jgi:hypothetical protein
MGLGHRLQLDLYLQTEQAGHQAPLEIGAEKVELRWALADWGVIPLNPTLYAEFVRNNDQNYGDCSQANGIRSVVQLKSRHLASVPIAAQSCGAGESFGSPLSHAA